MALHNNTVPQVHDVSQHLCKVATLVVKGGEYELKRQVFMTGRRNFHLTISVWHI